MAGKRKYGSSKKFVQCAEKKGDRCRLQVQVKKTIMNYERT
jgi:hypothetical protein